ncbi:phage tail protein [Saccharibacillus sacchari]|uniref:Tail fiber protein n=1 Tax=Saccharibacillus sacchari TaxID=456493 RepID=A0ACC6PAE8_9BACL
MSDQFVGEIRIFAGNYAPQDWAFCNGQLLPIASNTALFSLLGTAYGGDGRSTFGLPDLRGRAPLGQGNGAGLTPRTLGESVGSPTVTLLSNQMPLHSHTPQGISQQGGSNDPTGRYWAQTPGKGPGQVRVKLYGPAPDQNMDPRAINIAGGSQPHNNMQPFVSLNFIIALQGVFPPHP